MHGQPSRSSDTSQRTSQLRLEPGEFVDPERATAEWVGREYFLTCAHEIEPRIVTDLLTDDRLPIMRQTLKVFAPVLTTNRWPEDTVHKVEQLLMGEGLKPIIDDGS